MASLIPGYEYDIFISYRQKDNKGDRWVSEFVEALKTELESTFKEDISVYFDINPHDGLLETHDVDASLKDKLKCLIFIPIISRTYCDPKSFAWEHEFKAFIEQASEDQFGLKIKLPNGNVATRILPIQIHDLYPEDKALIEKELGGVLRAIEFIYKEQGVNRPLTPKDSEDKNSNKTNYRNQINKVANALAEIILGLRSIHTAPTDRNLISEQNVPVAKEGSEIELPKAEILSSKNINRWIVSVLLILLCIAGVFGILKIIEKRKQVNDIANLEKSIAVLPFINDSPVDSNKYFINGIMDEILINLQRIKEFKVLSRTSTEKYRVTNRLTISEIGKELDVNYIIEGSGQKYGNKFVLRVQLIAIKDEKHLWGESYEREIKETSDIIDLQSQIAQIIAKELKTTITPEEKQLIEESPTTNLTAYDFYQRGKEEYLKSGIYGFDREAMKRAEILFHKALEYDSTFAQAYAALGGLILKKWWRDYANLERDNLNNYLDSALLLADIALSFNNKLEEAYIFRGEYFAVKGTAKQAIAEWEKALKYNPNYWGTYFQIGGIYEELDIQKSLENLQIAASLNHGPQLIEVLSRIGYDFYMAGFPEKGNDYFLDALKLDGDSIKYSENIIKSNADAEGNFIKVIEHFEKRYLIDSTNSRTLLLLGYYNSLSNHYVESLKYYKKYLSINDSSGQISTPLTRYTHIGFAYQKNGYKKEAEYYFNKQIKDYSTRLTSVRPGEKIYCFYPLAGVYAAKGEKDKAYYNLKRFNENPSFTLGWVILLKNDPQFNSIRNETEFKRIIQNVEAKYQEEHERVRKWLEEKGKI